MGMKKSAFSILCLILFACPVFAMYGDPPFNATEPPAQIKKTKEPLPTIKIPDKEGPDDFYNELIQQDYGSNQSPAFDNTEEINPSESDYGYSSN